MINNFLGQTNLKEGATFCPKAKLGTTKYGPHGLYSPSSFNLTGLSLNLRQHLATAANFSKTKDTWSSYGTVKKHLLSCQRNLDINISFPMTNVQTLAFLAWLIRRGLKSSTINSYMSALRTIHLTKGVECPALRPPIIASVLEGRAHIDAIRARLENTPPRLPVTPAVLKLLKVCLNKWNKDDQTILLVWSVCLICFFGGFRVHEILSKKESMYDPAFTLLSRDIKVAKLRINGKQIETL